MAILRIKDGQEWEEIQAIKGDKGDQGIQGPQGPQGDAYEITQSDYQEIAVIVENDIQSTLDNKVDKVSGKGLSTNDFTNTYKNNVDSNTSARHTHSNKSALDSITNSSISSWNNKVTDNSYVHTDNNFTNTYKNNVDSNTSARHTHSNKTVLDNISSTNIINWNNKVTDNNYVHTDNNYTTEEKTKLSGLENYDDTDIKSDIQDLQTNKADTSDIPDVSNFITKDVNNLTNYTTTSDMNTAISNAVENKPNMYYIDSTKVESDDSPSPSTDYTKWQNTGIKVGDWVYSGDYYYATANMKNCFSLYRVSGINEYNNTISFTPIAKNNIGRPQNPITDYIDGQTMSDDPINVTLPVGTVWVNYLTQKIWVLVDYVDREATQPDMEYVWTEIANQREVTALNNSVFSHNTPATYVTRVSNTKIADNQYGSLQDENHGIILYDLEEQMYIQTPYGYQIRTERSGSTATKTVFGAFDGIVYNDTSLGNYIVIDVDIEDIEEVCAYKVSDNIASIKTEADEAMEKATLAQNRVNSFERKPGTQLFDYRNVEYYDGYFTNNTGLKNDSHMKTAIIPVNVTSQTKVTVHRGIISSRFVVGACAVKNPTKNTELQTSSANNSASELTIDINSNTKSILVYAYNSNYDETSSQDIFSEIMVQFGDTYTGYEDYEEILLIKEDNFDNDVVQKINSVLSNKKINFLGDSFTDDLISYEFVLKDRIEGLTNVHVAKGGSAITQDITWSSTLHSPSFINRIDGTAPDYDRDPSGNTKFRGLDTTADITVIFGGINDCYLLGNSTITMGNINSTHDTNTFYGGMQLLLDNIITMIPNQILVGVIPPSFQPNTPYTTYIGQIQEAEREIYQKYHIPYIDLAYDCFQMSDNPTIMALYRKSVTGTTNYHPNEDGQKAIANMVQSKMETIIRSSNNNALPEINPPQIDAQMSDVSTNPVQNRIIKGYVDSKVPATTISDAGKFLVINAQGNPEWQSIGNAESEEY